MANKPTDPFRDNQHITTLRSGATLDEMLGASKLPYGSMGHPMPRPPVSGPPDPVREAQDASH
jgi:hypothetical protein